MSVGRLNCQGNWLEEKTFLMRERSFYDQKFFYDAEWHSFYTHQYASYFGIWYNPTKKVIITFCEGDEMTVSCISDEHFDRELKAMREFYDHG